MSRTPVIKREDDRETTTHSHYLPAPYPTSYPPDIKSQEYVFSETTKSLVQIATTDAEKQEIYRLRYEVYIEEMRGGARHTEADSVVRQLRDDWDETAYHFYIRQDGEVVACARLNLRKDGPLECEEQFELERFGPSFPNDLCMTSRLVLHPRIRGSHLLKQLMCAMYRFVREQNLRYNFIDCHPQLLPLYCRLGFLLYRSGFNHQKYTYVFPMVLVLDDVEYLERVKSPFLSHARNFRHSTEGRDLLAAQFPSVVHSYALEGENSNAFWELLRSRLMDPASAIKNFELFETLTFEEAKLVASVGHIVYCRAGDVVLNAGDPGREMFLILNGSFQVQRSESGPVRGWAKILRILAAGEIFGEIRFLREELRSAHVVAREDSTLLILNAKALDRLVTSAPKAAAKVFRNLARIVTIRLCDSIRFLRFSKPPAACSRLNGI